MMAPTPAIMPSTTRLVDQGDAPTESNASSAQLLNKDT